MWKFFCTFAAFNNSVVMEKQVKGYTRRGKNGKTIVVKAHTRKCDGATCGKGAGEEFAEKKKKCPFTEALTRSGFSVSPSEKYGKGGFAISHMETGVSGKKEKTVVATFNAEKKTVKPVHGYFAGHPTGKRIQKMCKKLGIEFNNA